MDVSTQDGPGDAALAVEQCQCPPNYEGTSCERCAPGYYRSHPTPYLGICVPCECNGHADTCDPVTGQCLNCRDNTTGNHCEKCFTGYYGDPRIEGCKICSCPLPLASNNFAATCVVSESGLTTHCECLPGYYGPNCESCSAGHYGDPRAVGGLCQGCGCSGNINMKDPYSCDRLTGDCLICLNHTAGSYCNLCEDWWYGDAVTTKDCQPCECSRCGTESCGNDNGVCTCKPNVIGLDCNECAPYTWGFDYCTGCQRCDCGAASVTPQCDLRTGRCECQPHVLGEKCDQCESGYWNYGAAGCERCECMGDGAVTCDAVSGRCQCLPGVTGERCDRCLDRWILVPQVGCQECGYCVHILLDDLDLLDRNVTVTRRTLASVSVGVAAFQKLADINQTVANLRPLVRNLYSDTDPIDVSPLADQIKKVAENTDRTLDKATNTEAEALALGQEVTELQQAAQDIEAVVTQSARDGEAALRDVQMVLRQIMDRIEVVNIDTYILEAERILVEIAERDFTPGNDSALMELMEAKDTLNRTMQLKMEAAMQLEYLDDLKEDISTAQDRFYDLQNNTRFSDIDSRNALDQVQQLQSQNLDALKTAIDSIRVVEEEAVVLLDEAEDLISGSQDALNKVKESSIKLYADSGKLEQAQATLMLVVGDLEDGLEKVEPVINETNQHAAALAAQAAALDDLYTDTREVATNALQAANAYKDIVDAINSAENASGNAAKAAEDALGKTSGVGVASAESRERSTTLAASADDAYNNTRKDLADRLLGAVEATESLGDKNDEVENDLNEVVTALGSLPARDAGERAQGVIDSSTAAKDRASAARNQVKQILQLLPGDRSKLEQLTEDKLAVKRLLDGVEQQVNSARNIRRLTLLLGPLGTQAKNLTETESKVTVNMAQLREKIALARDEANRIRVGTRFLGNTSLTLRNPPNLEEAGSYSKISMFFKTQEENGMLFYLGGDQRSGRPDFQDDYISLEMVRGQVVFKFDLGSGRAVVMSPERYNDGEWHQLIATRIGKTGYLTIRTEKMDDVKVEGTSEGINTVLGLNPATAVLYVGGKPMGASLPVGVADINYVGVMEDLKFDEQSLGLWNFIVSENNNYGERERDVMKSVTSNGLRFNGKGYVILSKQALGLRPDASINVIFKFRTYADSGLLVYMTDNKKDFLSLELRDGKIFFQFDLGSNRATLMSLNTYNDGEWHQVQASRKLKTGLLMVDGKEVDKGDAPGGLKQLSISDDIFIGGYNQILIPTNDVTNIAFDGCIKDVQFGRQAWDLNENKRARGVARGCPDQIARVASFSADQRASLAVAAESIGESFDITFKFRTFENESLILYAASSDHASAFSVGIVDGRIVVMADPGGEMKKLTSKVNEYSDGKWHYVSIMKDGLVISMNIDDIETIRLTPDGTNVDLLTETPLYIGGLPSGHSAKPAMVPTTLRFVGCIGDVTVNKGFVNFASIKASLRIGANLAGCPLSGDVIYPDIPGLPEVTSAPIVDGEVEEPDVMTTIAPGQCALPASPDLMREGNIDGIRFGSMADSRHEFKRLPSRFRIRSLFELDFKTTAENGIILYLSDKNHIDNIALYMREGYVVYTFNCGSGSAVITSPQKYNDGKWHHVKFSRAQKQGHLQIDGERVGDGSSQGRTRSINVSPPFYLGGIPLTIKKKSANNLQKIYGSFVGCLKNAKLNEKDFGPPTEQISVKPCSDAMEAGSFFTVDQGYVKLYDNFKVGLDLEIKVDIKPRSSSGLILAVHSKGDYLVMQMVDGQIIVTTDNGMGAITATYNPEDEFALCNGQWHTIRAIKAKEVVTLVVDGMAGDRGQGKPGVSAADTNDPLYVGGVPDYSAKGIQVESSFTGCIRNLLLNGELQYVGSGDSVGSVKMDSCPVS